MAIIGDLIDLGVSDLLYMFKMRGITGRLVVRRDDADASLLFYHGRLVSVSSSQVWRRIGDLLVHLGKLSPRQLDTILARQAASDASQPIGSWLKQEALVSEEDLNDALRCQAEEILLTVLGWEQGSFSFNQERPPELAVPLPEINIEQIILEAVRQSDEAIELRQRIPNLNFEAILKQVPTSELDEPLSLKAAVVLRTIASGVRLLNQLMQATRMSEIELIRIVDQLARRELIGLKPLSKRAASAAANQASATANQASAAVVAGEPVSAGIGPATEPKPVTAHIYTSRLRELGRVEGSKVG